jgi:ABC-type lipoprotein release transport system permease subunit
VASYREENIDEETSADPAIFSVVTALLFIVTLSACFISARRASKIDPIVAIRHSQARSHQAVHQP